MIKELTTIWRGANPSGATAGFCHVPITEDGTIVGVQVLSKDPISGGAAPLTVSKNGVNVPGLAMLMSNASDNVSAGFPVTDPVSIAVVKGDDIVLNLTSNTLISPVTFTVFVDDGVDEAQTIRDTLLTGISFVSTAAVTAGNKIIEAAGRLQAQINVIFASLNNKFNTSDIDTDGTLAANSDTKVASQKAVRTYVAANSGGTSSVPDWLTNSPDKPPDSPSTYDDEFSGVSLGSKWNTVVDLGTTTTKTFEKGRYIWKRAGASNSNYNQMFVGQNAPGVNFTITAKCEFIQGTEFGGFGIALRAATGAGVGLYFYSSNGSGGISVQNLTTTAITGTNHATVANQERAGYFRIVVGTTNLEFYYSPNGVAYARIAVLTKATIFPSGISKIGMFGYNNNSDGWFEYAAAIDFFRVTTP
jgi:hypothetical protein